jgi:hypothetical protein
MHSLLSLSCIQLGKGFLQCCLIEWVVSVHGLFTKIKYVEIRCYYIREGDHNFRQIMKSSSNLSIMRFDKFSLYSVVTCCWNQYCYSATSNDNKFVIYSLRLSAGTISLKKIGPTVHRRGILHQTCSEC